MTIPYQDIHSIRKMLQLIIAITTKHQKTVFHKYTNIEQHIM